jgi:hypothetical protein
MIVFNQMFITKQIVFHPKIGAQFHRPTTKHYLT